jgi:hypothetical protein
VNTGSCLEIREKKQKSYPFWDSSCGPSSPQLVAIPSTLLRLHDTGCCGFYYGVLVLWLSPRVPSHAHASRNVCKHAENKYRNLNIFLSMTQASKVGHGLLIIYASRPHSHLSHSVGLLWTSDQTDPGTSTWKHTTLTRDRHPGLQRDSNSQFHKEETADQRLRPLV